MTEKKNKFVRVGTVMKSKQGEGSYVVLGNPKAKDDRYRLSVELTVKDASGKVIATQTDGFLSVFDPNEKAPPSVLKEISLKLPA
jgi:hypothetical protein